MTKEEKIAYNKKYRKEHKEEISAYNKKYRKEHKEEINAYRKEHEEEIRAYNKKYQEEHALLKSKNENNESKKRAFSHYRIWEYNDYLMLERYLKEGKTYKEIAVLMGRTISSIRTRVHLLKIEGNPYNKK